MSLEIDAIMAGLDELTEGEVIRLTLDLTENLVLATPVDTGWARANWVPTIGTPYEGGATEKEPTKEKAAAQRSVQSAASDQIAAYQLSQGTVWVSNNVPYLEWLNEGTSSQAPAAFVQTVIAKTITFGDYGGPGEIIERSSFVYRPGK